MSPVAENKVIAHFRGGTLVRGTTLDFHPRKSHFHLEDAEGAMHEVSIAELKAVFFVKDFEGDPDYDERKGFFQTRPQGKKITVEFLDGELMYGYSLSYSRRELGFFLFPGDPDSNNIKVFVVHESARKVTVKEPRPAIAETSYSK